MSATHEVEEIKAFLRDAVVRLVEEPDALGDWKDDTKLDDHYNSIIMVNLMVEIEDRFGIVYEPHEITVDYFSTIEVMTDFILQKLSASEAS
ncbi:hypothetical protein DUZ99_13045 [Xylanibacillus composti]|uniref:Acyl carrier protein n=1 Tax=Xylanibacillus composti TaxID=1572762 RepID=A0A8J4M4W3_9BACL|nr:hypothetical protein [Xylanibacillus composti]MDT9725900.1 hypothetical protein [Xylanibacillus composti]GIQ71271.1 hypothetical protein XYCOK13_40950 [Xylanibacillus composti]